MAILKALGVLMILIVGLKQTMLVVLGAFLTATLLMAFLVIGLFAIVDAFTMEQTT